MKPRAMVLALVLTGACGGNADKHDGARPADTGAGGTGGTAGAPASDGAAGARGGADGGASDVPGVDAAADMASAPDRPAIIIDERGPDQRVDATPDTARDAAPDAAPDATPDATPDASSDVVAACGHIQCDCTFKGIKLWGHVKIGPDTFPYDFTVAVVTNNLTDLYVQDVKNGLTTRCGQWQVDDALPDFRVKTVTNGLEDFRVQYDTVLPGIPGMR